MMRFDSNEHDHSWERFLAFARNDNHNNVSVISNEVRDLSPNCTTTRFSLRWQNRQVASSDNWRLHQLVPSGDFLLHLIALDPEKFIDHRSFFQPRK
jgi:hypothetical protein